MRTPAFCALGIKEGNGGSTATICVHPYLPMTGRYMGYLRGLMIQRLTFVRCGPWGELSHQDC